MGLDKLNERFTDQNQRENFSGMFCRDNLQNAERMVEEALRKRQLEEMQSDSNEDSSSQSESESESESGSSSGSSSQKNSKKKDKYSNSSEGGSDSESS